MSKREPKNNGKPLRRLRIERREAEARGNGWQGAWPPEKPKIDSAADCEHYLCRLEGGEQRAGFLAAIGTNLVAFFEHLKPEHFERFADVLLDVAENPNASHRSRLRAVQATIRPLRRAVALLPKLEPAGDGSLQKHLESLLGGFLRKLSAEDFGRLGRVLVELTGPAAKTTSDKVRACEAALTTVTEAMAMLAEVTKIERDLTVDPPQPDPELLKRVRADLAEAKSAELTDKHSWGSSAPVRPQS